jgi:hypothetical protein
MNVAAVICEAIRLRCLLEFDYQGHHRMVEPYCHGFSARGAEVLRAVQIAGSSRSAGFGFGKLWVVASMSNVYVTATGFVPNDPNYNPEDSAMTRIHCRI